MNTIKLISITTFLVATTGVAAAQVRYVSPSGSDTNSGECMTPHVFCSGPWKTVQHAVDTAPAGSTIRLATGTYPESVWVRADDLIIENHNGGAPVLDGSSDASWSKSLGEGDPYHSTLRITDSSNITVRGLTIKNAARQTAPCDASSVCRINAGVTVGTRQPTAGSPPPVTHGITIENNTFTGIKRPAPAASGAELGGLSLFVYGWRPLDANATHDIVIRDNHFTSNQLATSGINYNESVLAGNVRDALVAGNLYDNFLTPNAQRTAIAIEVGGNHCQGLTDQLAPADNHARRVVITDNTIDRVGAGNVTGIYVQGAQDVLIERNYIKGALQGMQVATEVDHDASGNIACPVAAADVTRNIWIRNNVVSEGTSAAGVPSFDLQLAGGSLDYQPVENIYVTSNTFHTTDAGSSTAPRIVVRDGVIGASKFLNNIVSANWDTQVLHRDAAGSHGISLALDFNLWQSTRPLAFHYAGFNRAWSGWLNYRALSGQDANSNFAYPGIVGPSTARSGFALSASSAALNVGTSLWVPSWGSGSTFFGPYTPAVELDHFGGARVNGVAIDVGADER